MQAINRDTVLAVLANHIGKDRGAHAGELVRELTGQASTAAAERWLRQIITQLRLEGSHICAHPSTGYFMASSPAELEYTCEFLYDRALASLKQISAMKKISLPDLRGQLKLPT